MGSTPVTQVAETLVQLVLRAHHTDELVQTDGDWRALGQIAARMLFWCGGAIYACRCEGSEIRFAVRVAHAPLGAMAHHISGAYAIHLRQMRGIGGSIFKPYAAIRLEDDTYLDELVLWLHRPVSRSRIWTGEDAYLTPKSLPWIDTGRILSALSIGAPGPATYRRRKSEPISPQAIEIFTRRPQRTRRATLSDDLLAETPTADHGTQTARPGIEAIARVVAGICKVSYGDMLTDTRKRVVTKSRVIATVLAARNGATAAAAARLFNRSRSTLIEQVEHYRTTQPEIFAEADAILEAFIAEQRK
jgi:hypothetical protein